MERGEMRGLIEKVTSLPTLPGVVEKVATMADREDTTASQLGNEISKDQVLSAKVLKLVNSGFYGFSQPVTRISHAMVLLGFNVVKTLVLSTTVLDMMAQSMSGVWEHSLACARTAAIIAKQIEMPDPEEISVAGLLHDLGKVAVHENLPEEYERVTDLIEREKMLLYQAEGQTLGGVTHATIGGWLLEKWSIPSKLVAPIAHHHDFHPVREHADRTAVIHLADILCRAEGFGSGGDHKIPVLNPEALNILDLTIDDLQGIMDQMNEELYDIRRI